jgi:hypothetical protein
LSSLADVHSLFLTYVMAAEDVVTRDDLMGFAGDHTEFLNEGLNTEGHVAQWCADKRAARIAAKPPGRQQRDLTAAMPLLAQALGVTQRKQGSSLPLLFDNGLSSGSKAAILGMTAQMTDRSPERVELADFREAMTQATSPSANWADPEPWRPLRPGDLSLVHIAHQQSIMHVRWANSSRRLSTPLSKTGWTPEVRRRRDDVDEGQPELPVPPGPPADVALDR